MHDPRALAHPVDGRHVVVAIGGGIAAYKGAELARTFIKAGATVRAAMTPAATEFIGPLTLQTLTGSAVATELFDLTQESEIGHIQAADGADLVVIAPTTANLIARLASGRANDIVSAIALATRAPLLIAPAMNVNMWDHPATRHNLEQLVARGVYVVGPGAGFLACRWVGPGRMAEPADILEAAARILTPQDLAGKKVVVSAGPTHEPIDPVRFIGNRSSGRMGYACALAAARRGADVTLVSGPVALEAPVGVEVVRVRTARDMSDAVTATSQGADVVIMSAAVADFRPRDASAQKIKKTAVGDSPSIELVRNPDILAALGAHREAHGADGGPVLVGFAAETEGVVDYARAKLVNKKCDLVVANDVSQPDAGFEVDTNRVTIVSATGAEVVELATKDEVAHQILDRVVGLLDG